MSDRRNSFWKIVRLVFGVALLVYFIAQIGVDGLMEQLRSADPGWVGAAFVIMIAVRILMAMRWHCVLASQGIEVSLLEIVRITFVAIFVGRFLPGTVGSDVVRGYELISRQGQPAGVLTTLVLDRFIGACTTFLIAAIGAFLIEDNPPVQRLAVPLFVVLVLTIAAWFMSSAIVGWLEKLKFGGQSSLYSAWCKLTAILRSLTDAKRMRSILPRMLIYSTAVQMLRCTVYYCLFRSLGAQVTVVDCMVFVPLVYVVIMLPISIGGIGTGQAALIYLYQMMGVATSVSLTAGILADVLRFAVALPGLLFWISGGRKNEEISE